MKVNRAEFAKVLNIASKGLSTLGVVPGSDMFNFGGGKIVTFDGEVRVQMKDPVGIDAAVPSAELLNLVKRFSTEDIDVVLDDKKSEVRVVGAGARAGIGYQRVSDMGLEIPKATGWFKPPETFIRDLISASKVCGQDNSMGITMCVRVQPDRIEACDNYRAMRIDRKTGVSGEFFLQADSVALLDKLQILKICVVDGWMHVRIEGGMISLRGRQFTDAPCLDQLMTMFGSEEISFPKGLSEGIARSQVFIESAGMGNMQYHPKLTVTLTKNQAQITTRSSRGWFAEDLKLEYEGVELSFSAHPDSLIQILDHSFALRFQQGRLLACHDGMAMVIMTKVPND